MFGLFDKPQLFKNQNYTKLKNNCLENRTLFSDKEFPPNLTSMFSSLANYDVNENEELSKVRWKRPGQLCEKPYLFVNGISTNDVLQGRLGNCWFVAACTCITVYRENWMLLIPDYKSQEWSLENKETYCGMFKFRFWRYGSWMEIIIDDLLPTIDNELIYCHSIYLNEFWSALLEKAYAKLLGSYEALEGGELIESLVDFTGGLAEPIAITEEHLKPNKRNSLFQYILKEHGNKSLIAAAIPAMSPEEQETETNMGLIIGHAYSITMVIDLPINANKPHSKVLNERLYNGYLRMLRLRNPWGQGEWKGPFCDGSSEWEIISNDTKQRVGLTFQDDGEFWMTFSDFMDNFKSLVICHQINDIFNKLSTEYILHGAWTGNLVGGCLNFKNSFLNNPQYAFTIESKNGEEVQMCLTQKMVRELNRSGGATGLLHIGYTILRIEVNRIYRVHKLDHCLLEKSSSFKNGRSIFLRIFLRKGRYAVIPCTFQPGQELSFMLRIYSKSKLIINELSLDLPNISLVTKFVKSRMIATRISVIKAVGLPRVNPLFGANPFFEFICENQKSVSSICYNTLNPEWDESFIFYRKFPLREHIVLCIYSKSGVIDDFIGKQIFRLSSAEDENILELELYNQKMTTQSPGTIFVQHQTYDLKDYIKL